MSKQKKEGATDQSIGVPVRGREAWVAITVDHVPPIRHKTSSSLWILLIIIHCNVYYAPLLQHQNMQKQPRVNTCYQFLKLLICLASCISSHILLMLLQLNTWYTCEFSPTDAICIKHQAAHMNYFQHASCRMPCPISWCRTLIINAE